MSCSSQQLSLFRNMLSECRQQKKTCTIRFATECGEQVKQECRQSGYEVVVWAENPNVATVLPIHSYVGLRRSFDVFETPEDRVRWMLCIS